MALIDTTTLLGIADRAAYQYNDLQSAFSSANQHGGGWYFDRSSSTDDADVEIPLNQPYQIVDNDLDVDQAIRGGTNLPNVINAMLVHFNIRSGGVPLQVGGWDGYLTTKDERVSWWFNKLHYAVKNQYLLANNVFSETDDVFGTVKVEAGPSLKFTDGVNYGTGSSLNRANGSNFSATQLKIVVGTMGGTNLDLRLRLKDINNLPTTYDVTVTGGSPSGTVIPVGTSSDRYLDMIGVEYVAFGSFGTLGDTITVHNLKERQISL